MSMIQLIIMFTSVATLGVSIACFARIAATETHAGVSCVACFDTGFDISGKVFAKPCKHGCPENHESPYWDLAQARR